MIILPDATLSGILRFLPAWAVPYAQLMRLDRPIGFWLLVLPCWWGQMIGASYQSDRPSLLYALLFFVGAVVMRGAGCVWNDYLDRDIDAKVARTAGRPLPSGRVAPWQALLFLFGLLFVGLIVALMLPLQGFVVAVLSLVLVAFYPFAKRFMSVPQLILGLVFAWGALVGFAVQGYGLFLPALFLYMGSACWVIGYDTIYAMQDMDDDLALGIGSSALAFGEKTHVFVALCYGLCLLFIGLAVVLVGSGVFTYVGLAAFGAHFAWQLRSIWGAKGRDPRTYLRLFISNRDAGLIFILGMLIDLLV